MGRYINQLNGEQLPHKGKVQTLITAGAKPVTFGQDFTSLADVPADKAVICVLNNGAFEAALYCYDQGELDETRHAHDSRPRVYLLWDKDKTEAAAA